MINIFKLLFFKRFNLLSFKNAKSNLEIYLSLNLDLLSFKNLVSLGYPF